MPGFKNAHIYPFTPNLAAARRLAGGQARTAILYTCNTSVCDQLTQIVKNNLAAIGIQVEAKKFSGTDLQRPTREERRAVRPRVRALLDSRLP